MKSKLSTVARLMPVVDEIGRKEPWAVPLVLMKHDVTRAEFVELDAKPGLWGYEHEGRYWHWKVRRFRNNPDLFPKWWKEAQ